MIVLDAKTDYSFMRGYGTPEQWLERCKAIGVTHFGVADYCSTWGHTFFRKAFKDSGVKLLYGVQLPVVIELDKDPRHSLVTLIARKDVKPLYDLVTLANKQSYYRPRVTWDQLKGFEGIIIVDHLLPFHAKRVTPVMYGGVAVKHPMLRVVPCYGPRFPSAETRQGYELFQSISGMSRIGEVEAESALHMMRDSEINSKFYEIATTNGFDGDADLQAEVEHITADIPKGTLIDSGIKDKAAELRVRAMNGARAKGLLKGKGKKEVFKDAAYAERLDRELSVIAAKQFEDYFFFIGDVVAWAKGRMFVGPGRGSSGGSLLCYFLGITTVDPIKFGTLFERFIDITRPDLPDIDTDFPQSRRDEVFAYLKETYGEHRVARLGTITEFGGKSAFNDAGKALGVPWDVTRELGKYTEGVGQGKTISPLRILGTNKEDTMLTDQHYALVEKWPQIKNVSFLVNPVKDGEEPTGHARHHGVHASGVVVTENEVTNFGSLTKEATLSMDMKKAEDLGLVKMDALGLRTLDVINTTCDLAGITPESLYDLDWEDPEVYREIFSKDRVTGIFQFEGNAVRNLMKGLGKVERFDDIAALTSLARPGPLIGGAAEAWVKARKGDEEARQLHPALESTFGTITYQEQMMHIMRDIGGFSEPDVQGARRAVGKKDYAKLKSYRDLFVKGATNFFAAQGIEKSDDDSGSQEKAQALWDELEEFGSYAFNLAHAVAYGMVSFMCAWLKLKFPLQFAAACLRYAADDEQGKNLLRELKEEGYDYVPFDVAKSKASWSIQNGKLYGGFDSVRGIGIATAQKMVAKRNADPETWLDELTDSQRDKLLTPYNTPWHSLTYFGDVYKELYKDPASFKRTYSPAGFKPPVLRIKDIPEGKGSYAFIGRILRVQNRDKNSDADVAKRDGAKINGKSKFINLTIEDDTGSVGATINRFKYEDFKWLTEQDMEGRDFFFRGNIINDTGKWLFLENVVELKEAVDEEGA